MSLTIHGFFVYIVDTVIFVDGELILLFGIADLPDLVFLVDEIAKLLEISGKAWVLR